MPHFSSSPIRQTEMPSPGLATLPRRSGGESWMRLFRFWGVLAAATASAGPADLGTCREVGARQPDEMIEIAEKHRLLPPRVSRAQPTARRG